MPLIPFSPVVEICGGMSVTPTVNVPSDTVGKVCAGVQSSAGASLLCEQPVSAKAVIASAARTAADLFITCIPFDGC